MSKQGKIPVLNDLIEKGIEIRMSDLGLDEVQINSNDPLIDDIEIDITEPNLAEPEPKPATSLSEDSELEQTVRRILDQHLELAWHEIKLAIRRELKKRPR